MKKTTAHAARVTTELQDSTAATRKLNRWIGIFFFVLCFLMYGKSIRNDYSMDDEFVIRNNRQVQQGIKAIPDIFTSRYVINSQKSSYEYRPMVKAFYALEYEVFGANPHVSHFFNVLLYAVCVLLLFFILRKLMPEYGLIFPFIVTTLFLIHPLHSEVVISIKNRDVILSFIGAFLSLYFYLRSLEPGKKYLVLAGAFFLLFALLSKKDAVTFFAVIPFTIWYFRKVPLKKLLWIFLSYAAIFLSFKMLIRGAAQQVERTFLKWENPLYLDTTILERIPTGIYCFWFYIRMYVLPYPLLSYYGYNQVPVPGWSDPAVWIILTAILAAVYFIIRNFRKQPLPVYGFLYYVITISMFTNVLVPVVGIVAERFAFIPSVGLSVLAAWGLLRVLNIPFTQPGFSMNMLKGRLGLITGCLVLVASIQVLARTDDWRTSFSLYEADAKRAKESAHLHSLYAAACIQAVREKPSMPVSEKRRYVAESVKHYNEALRIIPDYAASLNNLGMVFYTYYGKPEQATGYLEKAVAIDTNYVEAYYNLATCHAAMKNNELAEKYFLKTVNLDPEFTSSYFALSSIYASQGRYKEIVDLNSIAIRKGVKSDMPYVNIGNVHFMNKDTVSAVPYFTKAISINPNNYSLNAFLASYFKDQGDLTKANYYYDLMSRSTRK